MVFEGVNVANEHGREERPVNVKNEMRITQQGKTRMYISHGQSLLTEKGADSITIKAIGRAINKAVTTAEILKRRVEGEIIYVDRSHWHGVTDEVQLELGVVTWSWSPIADISSTSVVDTQQQHRQQQEGSQREDDGQLKKSMRRASVIIITLSFSPLDTTHIGYQPPLPPEEINPGNGGRGFTRERPGERGAISTRGRGRGGRRISGRGWRPRPPGAAIGMGWGGEVGQTSSTQFLGGQLPPGTISGVQPTPYPLGYAPNMAQGYGQMQGVIPGQGQPILTPPQGVRYPGDTSYPTMATGSVVPVQAYPQMYGNAGFGAVGMYSMTPTGYTPHLTHPGTYGGAPFQALPQWSGRDVRGGGRGEVLARGRGNRGGRGGLWRGGGFQEGDYSQPNTRGTPFNPDSTVR